MRIKTPESDSFEVNLNTTRTVECAIFSRAYNSMPIPPSVFIKEFDRAHGQVLSRYDGSVRGPDPNPASDWSSGPDPVLDSTVPLWTNAFVQYAQDELDYKTDMTYRLLNRDARNKWDFGTSPTRQGYAGVLEDIQGARSANPALEVLIATYLSARDGRRVALPLEY